MFKSRLTVTVPEPCHEDWNAMTRHDKGRFCQSCQKTVVDFTSMTDAEVVRWLTKQNGKTCGRFTEKQLARELTASTSGKSWTWRAVALGLSAWLSTKTAEAQTKRIESTSQQSVLTTPIIKPNATLTTSSQDSAVILKGQVVDAETNESLPGVSVLIKGSTLGTSTDVDGKFALEITSYKAKKAVILFSYIGYKAQEMDYLTAINERLEIKLQASNEGLSTGIVVTGLGYNWYSPRGLFNKVRNLLH